MEAIHAKWDQITESDLEELVENAVPESRTLEYKEALPGGKDSQKKEFLADVSSFANAAGGGLVLGVRQSKGVPKELVGLEVANRDEEILRLQNMIRDGIEPRIPSITLRAVPLTSGRIAVLISVPRSQALPHMVTYGGHSRFYSRHAAGKYPLDVSELRSLFALSETIAERVRRFRVERLAMIVAGETPIPLEEVPKIILHIVPFTIGDPSASFDVIGLGEAPVRLQPIYCSGWDDRYNLDGILSYGQFPRSEDRAHSYLQVFRNGSIEAVEAFLLECEQGADPAIPSVAYEREILKALPRFLAIQQHLGVPTPVVLMLSMVGVSGYTMAVGSRFFHHDPARIDRRDLILPDVLIDSYDCDPGTVLKPVFDAIWNAAGWPRCMNYDSDGKWIGH